MLSHGASADRFFRNVQQVESQIRYEAVRGKEVEPTFCHGVQIVRGLGREIGDEYTNDKHVGHRPLTDRAHQQIQPSSRECTSRGEQDRQQHSLDDGNRDAEQQYKASHEYIAGVVQILHGLRDTLCLPKDFLRLPEQTHRRRDREDWLREARPEQAERNEREDEGGNVSRGHDENVAPSPSAGTTRRYRAAAARDPYA